MLRVSAVVVDTSIWIDFFRGAPLEPLEDLLQDGRVLLAPVVMAELLSAPLSTSERRKLSDFLAELPLHPTPRAHWEGVGALRGRLGRRGLSVSTPDAHVAVCAIECGGAVWSADAIFMKMASICSLRTFAG
jgi:predicted nucleic acid-binding protein